MTDFANKVAVVTGAASGFGAATARRFAEQGASVVVADVDGPGAQAIAAEIGDRAVAVAVDVRNSAEVAAMIKTAEDTFGGLDILVNNAGLTRKGGPVEESSEDDFTFVFDVNVRGVYLGIKHGVPALRRRGGGVVLNTASIIAVVPRKNSLIYAASKGAVVTLTRAAALELAPAIRVNCVCPVAADTNFMRGAVDGDPAALEALRASIRANPGAGIPLGRLAEPTDVASAFTFLASDDARFLSGVVLPVDGGRSAGDTA
jgi:3-oxoacyl-[acyl-carrier protein] reductase